MKKRGKKVRDMRGRDGHAYPKDKPEVRPVQAKTRPRNMIRTRGANRGR